MAFQISTNRASALSSCTKRSWQWEMHHDDGAICHLDFFYTNNQATMHTKHWCDSAGKVADPSQWPFCIIQNIAVLSFSCGSFIRGNTRWYEETLEDCEKLFQMDTFGVKQWQNDIARDNPGSQKDNHGYSLLFYSLQKDTST